MRKLTAEGTGRRKFRKMEKQRHTKKLSEVIQEKEVKSGRKLR